jgi:hypothetical protein
MRKKIAAGALVLGILVLAVYGGRQMGVRMREQGARLAIEQTAQWSQAAQLATRLMIDKYGPPQWIGADRLEWSGPWPWKRIIIKDAPVSPLEEVVTYRVPPGKRDELAKFPHGLLVYADMDELGARSNSEELNRLTLNLASDIATGKMTASQASEAFLKTARLSAAGKSSPYLDRLLFDVPVEPMRAYPLSDLGHGT